MILCAVILTVTFLTCAIYVRCCSPRACVFVVFHLTRMFFRAARRTCVPSKNKLSAKMRDDGAPAMSRPRRRDEQAAVRTARIMPTVFHRSIEQARDTVQNPTVHPVSLKHTLVSQVVH